MAVFFFTIWKGIRYENNRTSYDYKVCIGKLENNLELVWKKRCGIEWSIFLHLKEKHNGYIIATGGYFSDLSLDSVSLTA